MLGLVIVLDVYTRGVLYGGVEVVRNDGVDKL